VIEDPYIEMREGVYRIRGSRVSLDSLVYCWRDGYEADEIQRAFPTLELAYYLSHKAEIDHYLVEGERQAQAQRTAAEGADPERYAELRRRMEEARKRLESASRSAML
jgi:hypothetical protein